MGDISGKKLAADATIAGMLTLVHPLLGIAYAAKRARDYIKDEK